MYKDYYSIKKDAFSFQLDPDLFFNSRQHKEAWYFLAYNFKTIEPYILLYGDHGTGKTTLCLRLIKALQKKRGLPYVYVQTPNYSYAHILKRICLVLNLEIPGEKDENTMQDLIYEYAEKNIKSNDPSNTISIIIDDAQDLKLETLRKLRVLGNLCVDGIFPFRFIFFSHTSFVETLKNPQLLALHQRVRRRLHLEPFDVNDTREYINFRLSRSGAPPRRIFTDDAVLAVYNYTRGIPRLINIICDTSLMLGAANRVPEITRAIVDEAYKKSQGVKRYHYSEDNIGKSSAQEERYYSFSSSEKHKARVQEQPPYNREYHQRVNVGPHALQDSGVEHNKEDKKLFDISIKNIWLYLLIFVFGLAIAIILDLGSIFKDL